MVAATTAKMMPKGPEYLRIRDPTSSLAVSSSACSSEMDSTRGGGWDILFTSMLLDLGYSPVIPPRGESDGSESHWISQPCGRAGPSDRSPVGGQKKGPFPGRRNYSMAH